MKTSNSNLLTSRIIWVASIAALMISCNTSRHPLGDMQNIVQSGKAVPVYNATAIRYRGNDDENLNIQFKQPVVVGAAQQAYQWGYFQFPTIDRNGKGPIHIYWSMHGDNMASYGNPGMGEAVSTDGRKKWQEIKIHSGFFGGLLLPNGDRIKIYTPKAAKTDTLQLPVPINFSKGAYGESYAIYRASKLPESVQGIYLERLAKGDTKSVVEHDKLDDSSYVRFSSSGMLPVIWWGDIHVLSDGSLLAGVYPGTQLISPTKVSKGNVLFYRSVDNGHSWKFQGKVTYSPDLHLDKNGNRRSGFTEPAYEVLLDGSLICVMRTTDGMGNSPMYVSRSTDNGVTWSKTEVLTPKGVLPRLLQLKNGVLALSSGRPGVQLRFSADGKGEHWTDPFEMLPYKDDKDVVSCGYTGLLATGKNSFLIVYSDFKYLNQQKEIRKAIKVREVFVDPAR